MTTDKIHHYPGKQISVDYDVNRCIHAGECVRGLSSVFNTQRKPWIDPDAAQADEVAAVVMRCPTGALHFTRHDGGQAEEAPDRNNISLFPNGPLLLRGDLHLLDADGEIVLKDTRIALCRCGASTQKPFCDGSHSKANFKDEGQLQENKTKTVGSKPEDKGALKVTVGANGPLAIKGEFDLVSSDGATRFAANRVFLCRCGASTQKPFCDGSHTKIGFTSDS